MQPCILLDGIMTRQLSSVLFGVRTGAPFLYLHVLCIAEVESEGHSARVPSHGDGLSHTQTGGAGQRYIRQGAIEMTAALVHPGSNLISCIKAELTTLSSIGCAPLRSHAHTLGVQGCSTLVRTALVLLACM